MGVVKLADYRPQLEVVEHRVADTEDGFMRVANEITLAAAPAHKVEAKDANEMPVDNRQGTITVSAEGLQVGDAFTIAGVNSVHQITKDTTGQPQVFRVLAVSGTTVTISPKILPPDNADVASRPYANVDANAASSAAITILNKNAAPANLFWADGSVELMYGKLAFPTGQGPQVMTATTEQGATLIMSYAFDHIKGVTTARFLPLLMPTNHQVFRQQLVAERLVRLPVQVLPAFWEHQHLGALALVLVSDCLARCFKG